MNLSNNTEAIPQARAVQIIESLSTRRSWGHERLPEVIRATMYMLRTSWRSLGLADARTPLFRLKVGRHNKILFIGDK